jgi:hypothetical protein
VTDVHYHTALRSLPAIAMLPLGLAAIILVLVHARFVRSDSRARNHDCSELAAEFRSEAARLASGGTVFAYTSHFNQQRQQCLVEITSKRLDDRSVYDQIFSPKDEAFIASRTKPASVHPVDDEVIVMGAPVPVQQTRAAQAWFTDLMTK